MALFDWDKANITHLKRHNVSPEEFEQAMAAFRVDLEAEEKLTGSSASTQSA